jgi:predicted nuclease with TOPRIM domain
LAYLSAVAGALGWVIQARYPALLPGSLKGSAHIYTIVFASLAGGLLIGKYVFREGYRGTVQELQAEKEGLAGHLQRLKGDLLKIREERDSLASHESVLKNRLKRFEASEMAAQESSLRKKIRAAEEDRRTALTFLLQDLKSRLRELEPQEDLDLVRAASVLKKELQALENEIKKGERSLYELVLMINEMRDFVLDLTLISLQSNGGPEESARGYRQPYDFHWYASETDPSRLERIYRFFKVAFHPDRFSSETLKEEAKVHFQEAVKAYSTLKERIRTTH